jgi:MFS family permease
MGESGLWRDRAFVLFWLGRAVSYAGSAVTAVVLPLLVYQLTGSALRTSLLATLELAPYLVFGLFAGALADRWDRRRLMVGCDLTNAALLGSIPAAAAAGALTLAHLYAVALLSAALFVWFDAAHFGALPALVGRERLVAANSALTAAASVIGIVGPAAGGALAAAIGAAPAVGLDAASFALSAVCLALIPRALGPARASGGGGAPGAPGLVRRTLEDIGEGLRFLWRQHLVRLLTLLGVGLGVTGGAVNGLLVVYAVETLGLARNDARIGWLFAAGAAGALLASLALPRLAQRAPAGRITLAGLAGGLVCLAGLALTRDLWTALALRLAWNLCYILVIITGISLRQRVTPDALQGRVNTTARMIAAGGVPFGAALGGVVAEAASVPTAYGVMAVGAAASLAAGWFSPLRQAAAALPPADDPGAAPAGPPAGR